MGADEVLRSAKDFSPSLTVVDTSTPGISNDVSIAVEIKRIQGVLLFWWVPTPLLSLWKRWKINESVDAVVRREYEHTVLELASLIKSGKVNKEGLGRIDGLTFRWDGDICEQGQNLV